jgi:transcriptional regulator with XRE-family HTH domain
VKDVEMKNYVDYYRKRARISQKNLAQLVNVSFSTIRRWEKGDREPRASDIQKLCEVLGVTEAELLNGPKEEGYKVTLNFVKTLEGVNDEMMVNGQGAVTLADDGTVMASHFGKLFSREDKETILAAIGEKLDEALETVERRMEKRKKLEGFSK